MTDAQCFVNDLADRSAASADLSGTFRDDQGIVRCQKCGERRVAFIPAVGRELPVACRCWEAKATAVQKSQAILAANLRARSSPFFSRGYECFTFEADSWPDSEVSRQCRAYVAYWKKMRDADLGLLFSGRIGTGKTFYAASIINALRARGISAIICTAANLVSIAQASRNPLAAIDELDSFELVALDDLGAQRGTDFGISLIEGFINARVLSMRPLIITTNLSAVQMRQPEDLRWARTFDRVLTLCPQVIVTTGDSLRKTERRDRAAHAAEILHGGEVGNNV